MAKRLRTSTVQLIRDALTDKLDYLEAKFRAEEERRIADKEAKKAGVAERRILRGLKSAPERGPVKSVADSEEEPLTDYLDDVYALHAQRVLEVVDSAAERRLRIAEAVAAIKSQAPLTHPEESEIIATLEKYLVQLRDAAPAAKKAEPTPKDRVSDALVGKVVDPQKTRTFGDVE